MQGGYNVAPLIECLSDADEEIASTAADQLKKTLLVFDAFYDVETLAKSGNKHAASVIDSWANAEWFLTRPAVPEKMTVTVFKVTGETNTDDLSPAPDAWSRPDIPLHGLAMLKTTRDGINPNVDGECGPIDQVRFVREIATPCRVCFEGRYMWKSAVSLVLRGYSGAC